MPTLFRDFETRSTLNLADVGAWRYAADLTTEVLVVCFAVDDDPVEIWTPGQPIPEAFVAAARDPGWLIAAHNDMFESAIEARLLHPRFHWPLVPIARHRCTMAMALASAMPASLEGVAAAIGLSAQKDRDGRRLMMAMAKPRKPRKGESCDATLWHDDPERRLRLQQYCANDVLVERELFKRLPPLSADEQALWEFDAAVNRRGFRVDLELAEAARAIVRAEQAAIDAEIAERTDGRVTSVNQVAKLQAELQGYGHTISGLTKRSVSAVLAHEPSDDVRQLLELRQEGSRAAPRKLDSLIGGADDDGRLRGTLKYHGASTGRWAGSRFQPQNLKKPQIKDLDSAIGAIRSGDLARVRTLGAPLAIAGDISRALICAAPGHVLIGADFSAVESRVLAWISAEKWKIDTYTGFDQTGDPALEPYCQTASRILGRTVTADNEADRAIGKTCDLAFGYGGGLGAWRRFDNSGTYSDDQVERFKAKWRAQHAATVRFWHALENLLRRALRTRERRTLGNLAAEFGDGDLYLTLPSGRRLTYPEARLEPGKFAGTTQIVFKDNAHGGWSDVRGWHGIFVENVVAGIARDLLAQAMLRLEAAGFPIVLHVHDEAVAEVPEGAGNIAQFLELMTTLPDWAAGLPLVAKGWANARYGAKSQPAPILRTSASKTPLIPPILPSRPLPPAFPAPKIVPAETTQTCPPAAPAAPKPLNGHAIVRPAVSAIVTTEDEFAHISLPALIGEPLVNGKIICPFHDDRRPSLHVYADHFHCYTCGARGDRVDWLMMIEGLDRAAALRFLAAWDGPTVPAGSSDNDGQTLELAARVWDEAKPIGADTLAARYLRDIRGIDVDALPKDDAALRFHPKCPIGTRGGKIPCLIALFRDVLTDAPAGIHRILLTDDVMFLNGKVRRYTLGRWPAPRAIKLWPAGEQLFIGEGVETVLAAATRFEYRDAPMLPAWAAGPGGMISKIPPLPNVRQLVLLVDHDAEGQGEKYANACRQVWSATGREVVRLRPHCLGDFNDLALEQASAS